MIARRPSIHPGLPTAVCTMPTWMPRRLTPNSIVSSGTAKITGAAVATSTSTGTWAPRGFGGVAETAELASGTALHPHTKTHIAARISYVQRTTQADGAKFRHT